MIAATLYKRDKKGNLMQWVISHDDMSYWTSSGRVDGVQTKTAPTFVERKNVGKANETTLEEQVVKEVNSKIVYQLDHGYTYDIPDFTKEFEVSLAAKYTDRKEKNKLNYPYIFQPKLDGCRAYLKSEAEENDLFGCTFKKIELFSRGKKEFKSVEHLKSDTVINAIFDEFPDIILDGELYNHELKADFNRICSLVKKTKPSAEDLAESAEKIYFNCFDCYFQNSPELTFMERNGKLIDFVRSNFNESTDTRFTIVNSDTINLFEGENKFLNNDDEVEEKIREYITKGFEGIMLKKDVPYFFGRSEDLLKYKFFKDDEYEIVNFEEGKGNLKGIAASVVCKAVNGTEFKAGVMGTQEEARYMFENRDKYKGMMATIKYQELTPLQSGKGGVPRFGKMVTVRDYE